MKLPCQFLILAAALLPIRAEVECPPVFGSHMLMPRDQPVPMRGITVAGDIVKVQFGGEKTQVTASQDGARQVKIPLFVASEEPQTLVVSFTKELRFDDLPVGAVWLCSGQSNMEKKLGNGSAQRPMEHADEVILNVNHSLIRLFQMPQRVSLELVVTVCRLTDYDDSSWVMILETGRLRAKKFRQNLRMAGVISI